MALGGCYEEGRMRFCVWFDVDGSGSAGMGGWQVRFRHLIRRLLLASALADPRSNSAASNPKLSSSSDIGTRIVLLWAGAGRDILSLPASAPCMYGFDESTSRSCSRCSACSDNCCRNPQTPLCIGNCLDSSIYTVFHDLSRSAIRGLLNVAFRSPDLLFLSYYVVSFEPRRLLRCDL